MLRIVVVWYLLGIRNSVSYWYADDDYANLSLAHALSFDQWRHGDPQIGDVALTDYPGILLLPDELDCIQDCLPASGQLGPLGSVGGRR